MNELNSSPRSLRVKYGNGPRISDNTLINLFFIPLYERELLKKLTLIKYRYCFLLQEIFLPKLTPKLTSKEHVSLLTNML